MNMSLINVLSYLKMQSPESKIRQTSYMEERMLDYDLLKRENSILKEENKLLRNEILKRTDKMEKTELIQLLEL